MLTAIEGGKDIPFPIKRIFYMYQTSANLRVKLGKLDSYIEQRRVLSQRYHEALSGTSLILPKVSPNCQHAYYLYVCRHTERDRIISNLVERFDIKLNVSYRWPIHLMKGYECLEYRSGDLPNTEKSLP